MGIMVYEFEPAAWRKHNVLTGSSGVRFAIVTFIGLCVAEGLVLFIALRNDSYGLGHAASLGIAAGIAVLVVAFYIYFKTINTRINAKTGGKRNGAVVGSMVRRKIDKYVTNNLQRNFSYVEVCDGGLVYRDVQVDSNSSSDLNSLGMSYFHKESVYTVKKVYRVEKKRNTLEIYGIIRVQDIVLRKYDLTSRPYMAEEERNTYSLKSFVLPLDFKNSSDMVQRIKEMIAQ